MKLYYAAGACSLADHIALKEAGMEVETIPVDLKSHRTSSGDDFQSINPKGYVPALVFDSGETLTENVAILDWIAGEQPALRPEGPLGRSRLLEMLAFISTELHKTFRPFFQKRPDDEKGLAGELIGRRLAYLADRLDGEWLLGDRFTVADPYLFTMLTWVDMFGLETPATLASYAERVRARPAVAAVLQAEATAR